MGLFWRKKARIERERKENTHKIVCLFCFRSFGHDRVMFRALEALDADGYTARYDDSLDGYRNRFGLGSAGEIEATLDPDDFDESRKKHHKGILVSLADDYGNITARRICPFCHNDISQIAGFAPAVIFAVTGAARAGKSVFFTCLIHHIRTVLSRHYPSYCAPVDSETGRMFKHGLAVPLLENGILPVSALLKECPDMPLVFTFSMAGGGSLEASIVFFDPAGDSSCMDIHSQLMKSAKGVMLLVDPLSIPGFGKRLAEKSDPDFDPLFFTEPVDDLGLMLLEHAGDVPIAVVLTKTDLLGAAPGEHFDSLSAVFDNFCHEGFFDTSEHDEIDAEIHNFLSDTCPNFFNALKKRFEGNLGFFGVSALGERPVAGHVNNVNPVRIGEPFLWLLYSLGIISDEGEA